MKLQSQIEVRADADAVWEIVGRRFAEIQNWARPVFASEGYGSPDTFPAAAYAGRTCDTTIGPIREALTEYDEKQRRISFDVTGDKMPKSMRSFRGGWRVEPSGAERTLVRVEATLIIAPPFNLLMGPMMKLRMGGALKQATQDLQHYVETGYPHPAKVKMAAKRPSVAH